MHLETAGSPTRMSTKMEVLVPSLWAEENYYSQAWHRVISDTVSVTPEVRAVDMCHADLS